jgi:hypothetical protein
MRSHVAPRCSGMSHLVWTAQSSQAWPADSRQQRRPATCAKACIRHWRCCRSVSRRGMRRLCCVRSLLACSPAFACEKHQNNAQGYTHVQMDLPAACEFQPMPVSAIPTRANQDAAGHRWFPHLHCCAALCSPNGAKRSCATSAFDPVLMSLTLLAALRCNKQLAAAMLRGHCVLYAQQARPQ